MTSIGGREHAIEARRLLRASRHGSMATLSQRLDGYPYASAVAFMSDHDASPVLLVSRLAEHTRNIAADPRASLLVSAPGADVQAGARLTLAGMCRRVDDPNRIQTRYLRVFPAAHALLDLDFEFYKIHPVAVRYIGGFGSMQWLSAQAFAHQADALVEVEEQWLQRINAGELLDLQACVHRIHPGEARHATVVGLDSDGIDVNVDGQPIRIPFAEPVERAEELPAALAQLGGKCD